MVLLPWGMPSSAMRYTKALGRAMLDEQNLALESGSIRVHLIVRQSAVFGCELTLSRVVELSRKEASDSESSVSGVDVTATGVHLSPFRDPNLGDEFGGQEISFEAPESRDVQVLPDSQRTPTTPEHGSPGTQR